MDTKSIIGGLIFSCRVELSFDTPIASREFRLHYVPTANPHRRIVSIRIGVRPRARLRAAVSSFNSIIVAKFVPRPRSVFDCSIANVTFISGTRVRGRTCGPLCQFGSTLAVPNPAIRTVVTMYHRHLTTLPSSTAPIRRTARIVSRICGTFICAPNSAAVHAATRRTLTRHGNMYRSCTRIVLSIYQRIKLATHCVTNLLKKRNTART